MQMTTAIFKDVVQYRREDVSLASGLQAGSRITWRTD